MHLPEPWISIALNLNEDFKRNVVREEVVAD